MDLRPLWWLQRFGCGQVSAMAAATLLVWMKTGAQEALHWEASSRFEYQLKAPVVTQDASGRRVVTVQFAVVDPQAGNAPWDIKAATEFRQPADVRNCLLCHVDRPGKGTFELPVDRTVLGTTLHSGSVPGVMVDVDPANDLRMSPTVGACSACHDDVETLEHMMSRRTGGSFQVLQADLSSGRIVERCVDCHGPGGKKDIRKVHGVRAVAQVSDSRPRPSKRGREEDKRDRGDDDDSDRD